MRFEFEFGNLRFFALFNFNVRMIRIFYFISLLKFNVLISAYLRRILAETFLLIFFFHSHLVHSTVDNLRVKLNSRFDLALNLDRT